MYEVRAEAEFSAAHYLQDYHGKCENLHGHNYTVYAHARGTELDSGGMLVDFGILKKALREVCGKLDHTNQVLNVSLNMFLHKCVSCFLNSTALCYMQLMYLKLRRAARAIYRNNKVFIETIC